MTESCSIKLFAGRAGFEMSSLFREMDPEIGRGHAGARVAIANKNTLMMMGDGHMMRRVTRGEKEAGFCSLKSVRVSEEGWGPFWGGAAFETFRQTNPPLYETNNAQQPMK